ERTLCVDCIEHSALEPFRTLDAEVAAEREQPLGEWNDAGIARQPRILKQQPHPFELMTRLAQASLLAGRDRPVRAEELDQGASPGIDEARLKEIDEGAGPAQPILF